MNAPKSILIFTNGNYGVFDGKGVAIPELNTTSVIALLAQHLESLGVNPEGIEVEIAVGNTHVMKIVKVGERWTIQTS